MVALEQLSPDLIPSNRIGWVSIMSVQAHLELLKLCCCQGCGCWILSRDAVPNVLCKLDALGDGKA